MLPFFFNGLLSSCSYLVGMERRTSRCITCKRDNSFRWLFEKPVHNAIRRFSCFFFFFFFVYWNSYCKNGCVPIQRWKSPRQKLGWEGRGVGSVKMLIVWQLVINEYQPFICVSLTPHKHAFWFPLSVLFFFFFFFFFFHLYASSAKMPMHQQGAWLPPEAVTGVANGIWTLSERF